MKKYFFDLWNGKRSFIEILFLWGALGLYLYPIIISNIFYAVDVNNYIGLEAIKYFLIGLGFLLILTFLIYPVLLWKILRIKLLLHGFLSKFMILQLLFDMAWLIFSVFYFALLFITLAVSMEPSTPKIGYNIWKLVF